MLLTILSKRGLGWTAHRRSRVKSRAASWIEAVQSGGAAKGPPAGSAAKPAIGMVLKPRAVVSHHVGPGPLQRGIAQLAQQLPAPSPGSHQEEEDVQKGPPHGEPTLGLPPQTPPR